jgi:hypothetical protein
LKGRKILRKGPRNISSKGQSSQEWKEEETRNEEGHKILSPEETSSCKRNWSFNFFLQSEKKRW